MRPLLPRGSGRGGDLLGDVGCRTLGALRRIVVGALEQRLGEAGTDLGRHLAVELDRLAVGLAGGVHLPLEGQDGAELLISAGLALRRGVEGQRHAGHVEGGVVLPGAAISAADAEQTVGAGSGGEIARPLEFGGSVLVVPFLDETLTSLQRPRGVLPHDGDIPSPRVGNPEKGGQSCEERSRADSWRHRRSPSLSTSWAVRLALGPSSGAAPPAGTTDYRGKERANLPRGGGRNRPSMALPLLDS